MCENASIVELIKTVTSEGKGTPGDPCRLVTRYWTKEGILLFKEGTQRNNHMTVNINSVKVDADSIAMPLKKSEILRGFSDVSDTNTRLPT